MQNPQLQTTQWQNPMLCCCITNSDTATTNQTASLQNPTLGCCVTISDSATTNQTVLSQKLLLQQQTKQHCHRKQLHCNNKPNNVIVFFCSRCFVHHWHCCCKTLTSITAPNNGEVVLTQHCIAFSVHWLQVLMLRPFQFTDFKCWCLSPRPGNQWNISIAQIRVGAQTPWNLLCENHIAKKISVRNQIFTQLKQTSAPERRCLLQLGCWHLGPNKSPQKPQHMIFLGVNTCNYWPPGHQCRKPLLVVKNAHDRQPISVWSEKIGDFFLIFTPETLRDSPCLNAPHIFHKQWHCNNKPHHIIFVLAVKAMSVF